VTERCKFLIISLSYVKIVCLVVFVIARYKTLYSPAVADPDQAFGGAVKLGGAKMVFTCLNTKVCLRQSLGAIQKWLPFVGQKVSIFVGRTTGFFRENHSLKAL